MSVVEQYRAAFEALTRAADEPAYVTAARRAAFERFAANPFPTRRDEDWKYTAVGDFGRTYFAPDATHDDAAIDALVSAAQIDGAAAVVVLVGGRFDVRRSRVDDTGLVIRPLASAWDEETAGLVFGAESQWFSALRDAFAVDGVVISSAPDAKPAGPIHVIHASASDAPALSAGRVVVRLGGHSEVSIVESFVASDVTPSLSVTGLVARYGDGAQLDHARIQALPIGAGHVAADDVIVCRDATYRSFAFSVGGTLSRDDTGVRVEGSGAHTELIALSLVGDGQLIDHHTSLDHRAPGCTADQHYKTILDGDGHGVFNGKVFVRKVAQQTNANQLNQNLMLSERARMDTKPQLEIFADDVRCTHGATIGQIAPEELFYMMSRAIPEAIGRRMIVRGFADEVIERVRHEGTGDKMRALLDERLSVQTGA
jgi:Fe-S cluster assembly protein SufD